MKTLLITSIALLIGVSAFSQALGKDKYWIPLRDKENNSYNLTDPGAFLSERALERRASQNIPVTAEDIPVSQEYVDSLASLGLHIRGTSRWFNAVIVESSDTALLDTISHISFIADFSPREIIFTPTSSQQYSVDEKQEIDEKEEKTRYGRSDTQTMILNGKALHDLGFRGEGMHIGVIDAGFTNADSMEAFAPLFDEGRMLGYKDFVDPGGEFFTHSSHGSAVLSTMAADLPGSMIGTAPEASYWLLRSEDAATEYRVEEAYWVLAAEFADSVGVDVINSSLGYSNFYDSTMNYTHEDLDGKTALVTLAAEKAFSKGMLVVVSAGNEGNNIWQRITPPADAFDVLTVGGIDTSRNLAIFSSLGPTADGRIKPDVVAVGYRTIILNSFGYPVHGYGTSFSSPQIAGLSACLWQAAPEKTNREILEAVRSSANQFSNPDTLFGFGIPNFMLALWELKTEGSFGEKNPVVVFPNPFINELQVDFTGLGSDVNRVSIFNSAGELVYSKKGKWQQGDFMNIENLRSFSPGIYFLVVNTPVDSLVTKIIRQQ